MRIRSFAVLREDAGFHAYQMLEAGVRQFFAWGNIDEGQHVLVMRAYTWWAATATVKDLQETVSGNRSP